MTAVTGSRFGNLLSCPDCDGAGDVSLLAYDADILLECYGCGRTAEFTIGADTPFRNLRTDVGSSAGESATD